MKLKNAITEAQRGDNLEPISTNNKQAMDFRESTYEALDGLYGQQNILKKTLRTGNTKAKTKALSMLDSIINDFKKYEEFLTKNFGWD